MCESKSVFRGSDNFKSHLCRGKRWTSYLMQYYTQYERWRPRLLFFTSVCGFFFRLSQRGEKCSTITKSSSSWDSAQRTISFFNHSPVFQCDKPHCGQIFNLISLNIYRFWFSLHHLRYKREHNPFLTSLVILLRLVIPEGFLHLCGMIQPELSISSWSWYLFCLFALHLTITGVKHCSKGRSFYWPVFIREN